MKCKSNHPVSIICGIVLMLAALPLHAATNYVAQHTGGTYDGASWATAFTNVQEAVTAGGSDSVILVAGGTYALPASLSITATNILVKGGYEGVGAGPGNHDPALWSTTLSRGGTTAHRTVQITGGHDARIEDLIITGGNVNEGAGVRIDGASQRVVLENCTIRGNSYSANTGTTLSGGGVYIEAGTSAKLVGCTVADNSMSQTRDSAPAARGGGIYSAGELVLSDCIVVNNLLSHVSSETTRSEGMGIYVAGGALELFNVLVSGNSSTMKTIPGGAVRVASGTATLVNCTVADHGFAGLVQAGSSAVSITNSILYSNWGDVVGTATVGFSNIESEDFGGSNISSDPHFEYGYYLSPSSPSAGAGSATASSLGLATYAKNSAGDVYEPLETVNMGFHYPTGFDLLYPDVYVDPTGDDALNDGKSAGQPFSSITNALAKAHHGTRIHLAAGEYTTTTETFPLNISDKFGISITGTNSSATRINASGSKQRVMTILRAHRLVISGVTITGGSGTTGAGVRIDDTQNIQIEDSIVSDNKFEAKVSSMRGGGLYAGSGSELVIYNCIFRGNVVWNQHDPSSYRAYGGGLWSGGRLVVRDSVITNNTVRQGQTVSLPGGSGIHFEGDRLEVINSLLVSNIDYSRPAGAVQVVAGTAALSSLTVADNGSAGIRGLGGTVGVENSILWGNGIDSTGVVSIAYSCVSNSTDFVDGGHNITETPPFPLFIDASAADYRLADNSPCINAGINRTWMTTATDLSGMRRIMAGSVDMGVYEWEPPSSTVLFIK